MRKFFGVWIYRISQIIAHGAGLVLPDLSISTLKAHVFPIEGKVRFMAYRLVDAEKDQFLPTTSYAMNEASWHKFRDEIDEQFDKEKND